MAKKRYSYDERRIQRLIRQGRGTGTGINYKPWLTVSDVPSKGRSHRPYCPITRREHHLLSDNEYYGFLYLLWKYNIIDIREQFPLLDRRETFEIAALCNVRHPVDPVTGALWVMTTDFLITLDNSVKIAVAIKDSKVFEYLYGKKPNDRRIWEKLEIERRYWERRCVRWELLTSRDVKTTFTSNLAWIYDEEEYWASPHSERSSVYTLVLTALIAEKQAAPLTAIKRTCQLIDQRYELQTGTSLAALRRLLWNRSITVDLKARRIQNLPLEAFTIGRGIA